MAREIVTVVGATGVQSGSIIDELLNAEKVRYPKYNR